MPTSVRRFLQRVRLHLTCFPQLRSTQPRTVVCTVLSYTPRPRVPSTRSYRSSDSAPQPPSTSSGSNPRSAVNSNATVVPNSPASPPLPPHSSSPLAVSSRRSPSLLSHLPSSLSPPPSPANDHLSVVLTSSLVMDSRGTHTDERPTTTSSSQLNLSVSNSKDWVNEHSQLEKQRGWKWMR